MRVALLVAALVLAGAGLAAAAGPADEGKSIFQKDCGSCHTIGRGDGVGPDLEGVTTDPGVDAVKRFVAAPDKEIASGSPRIAALVKRFRGVQMPNFHLTGAQVDAVVAYLQTQSGGAAAPSPAPKVPTSGADAAAGKRLFTGGTALANGGPACVSCHTMAGVGTLGGGRVGPDLTKAYAKYGGVQGVTSVLTTIAFPTMIPVYKGHALTKRDAANLAAFLALPRTKQQSATDRTWLLVLLGASVTAALFAAALVVWPRRRLVVRRRLVPSTKPRG